MHFVVLFASAKEQHIPQGVSLMKVLLIEGDSATVLAIRLALQTENFNVHIADLGEEGIDLGKRYDCYGYDIILLDLNVSDVAGFEVLRALRRTRVATPIILLGSGGVEDRVQGLRLGADDYVMKPFHGEELVARIYAVVRRSQGHAESVIVIGDLTVNLDMHVVEVGGTPVHLTPKEYLVVELLTLRKDRMVTKETLMNHLYGGLDEPGTTTMGLFIHRLRKKLAVAGAPGYIETVWGRGWILREPDVEPLRATA